jgi:hypothetical protein
MGGYPLYAANRELSVPKDAISSSFEFRAFRYPHSTVVSLEPLTEEVDNDFLPLIVRCTSRLAQTQNSTPPLRKVFSTFVLGADLTNDVLNSNNCDTENWLSTFLH